MSAAGKDTTTSTTPNFIAALIVGLITVAAFTLVFVLLHNKFKHVYQPRRELAPNGKKPRELPGGIIPWWRAILSEPDEAIITYNGVDAYLFLRFIKVFGLYMLVPYTLLTFIILIPVSAASPNAGQTGLNILTFGNVATDHQDRHVAHLVVAVILIAWTLFLLYREYQHFVAVRQAWLSSETHISLARTRTVLLANVPASLMTESAIREIASSSSVSVERVWLSRKLKDMETVYDERNDECLRIEASEGKLLAMATKNEKKGKTPVHKGTVSPESSLLADKYVPPKKQPSHKLGFLGLLGKKLDLQTAPEYISSRNTELAKQREQIAQQPLGDSVFIRFFSQQDAHRFAREVSLNKETKALKSSIEVIPEDVIWNNTTLSAHQRKIGYLVGLIVTIVFILFFSVLVAFVGSISNIDALCQKASWLAWVCRLPSAVLGIIKGILPPVLLAILFMLVPPIFRKLIKLGGLVLYSEVELLLFSRFSGFLIFDGFLIVTLASGLIPALSNIAGQVSELPNLLANNLPGASIFFLTFVLASNFGSAAQAYSRVVPVVMHLLRGLLEGNTPRKVYKSRFTMQSFPWATVFPNFCLLILITIVYSVIQPIITLTALVACGLYYLAYSYLLKHCADQPDVLETGGLYYSKALGIIFAALYIEEICLAGLFFLTSDPSGSRAKSGIAGGVIMIVMIVVTAMAQIYFQTKVAPKSLYLYSQSSYVSGKSNIVVTDSAEKVQQEKEAEAFANGTHEHAFSHPASWKPQPVIWIANDSLHIGQSEVERLKTQNVDASCEFARLDSDGKMTVDRCPPDEHWTGNTPTQ